MLRSAGPASTSRINGGGFNGPFQSIHQFPNLSVSMRRRNSDVTQSYLLFITCTGVFVYWPDFAKLVDRRLVSCLLDDWLSRGTLPDRSESEQK